MLESAVFTPEDRVVFVSDVHLRYGDADYLAQFLGLLQRIREARVAALYIHGDLFDFYVGPRQGARPFYRPLFQALGGLVEGGVPVGVLHGNRDFLMGRCFRQVGCEVLPDEIAIRLGDLRTHLSHGDAFCIHDRSYQFWGRGVLRAAPVGFVVSRLPVSVATWLARRYRKVSARKFARHAGDSQGRLPTVFDGVRQLLASEPFDAVICGHIHQLAATDFEHLGRRATLWTTGAWEQKPNTIEWVEGRLRLCEWEPAHLCPTPVGLGGP